MTEKSSSFKLNDIIKDIDKQLCNLENKAELSRYSYLFCKKRLETLSNRIICVSIPITLILAGLSIWISLTPSIDNSLIQGFTILLSLIAIAISFLSLSDRIFGWNEKKIAFEMGFKILTSFIREVHSFRKIELKLLNEELALQKMTFFREKYSAIASSLPENDLTDQEFLRCKKNFFLKKKISIELDKNPCFDIDSAYSCEDLSFQKI